MTASTPELRETEHYYLDLGKLQPEVVDFLRQREITGGRMCCASRWGRSWRKDLRGRPITRDLDWGIPVPLEGWEGKCLYVWFEAVIGYLSAAIEWRQLTGSRMPGGTGGTNPQARAYYFIGKDNIPFHAIIWPAAADRCRHGPSMK